MVGGDKLIKYDKDSDSLMVLWGENRPAVSEDFNGEFWKRIDPITNEIIGIEIEDISRLLLNT